MYLMLWSYVCAKEVKSNAGIHNKYKYSVYKLSFYRLQSFYTNNLNFIKIVYKRETQSSE